VEIDQIEVWIGDSKGRGTTRKVDWEELGRRRI
jgi:hypothetical protein